MWEKHNRITRDTRVKTRMADKYTNVRRKGKKQDELQLTICRENYDLMGITEFGELTAMTEVSTLIGTLCFRK